MNQTQGHETDKTRTFKSRVRGLMIRCRGDALDALLKSIQDPKDRAVAEKASHTMAVIFSQLTQHTDSTRWPNGFGIKPNEQIALIGKSTNDTLLWARRLITLPRSPGEFLDILETFLNEKKMPPLRATPPPPPHSNNTYRTRSNPGANPPPPPRTDARHSNRSEPLHDSEMYAQQIAWAHAVEDLESIVFNVSASRMTLTDRSSLLVKINEKFFVMYTRQIQNCRHTGELETLRYNISVSKMGMSTRLGLSAETDKQFLQLYTKSIQNCRHTDELETLRYNISVSKMGMSTRLGLSAETDKQFLQLYTKSIQNCRHTDELETLRYNISVSKMGLNARASLNALIEKRKKGR